MQVGAVLATVAEATFVVDVTQSIFICGAPALGLVHAIVGQLIGLGGMKRQWAVMSCMSNIIASWATDSWGRGGSFEQASHS